MSLYKETTLTITIRVRHRADVEVTRAADALLDSDSIVDDIIGQARERSDGGRAAAVEALAEGRTVDFAPKLVQASDDVTGDCPGCGESPAYGWTLEGMDGTIDACVACSVLHEEELIDDLRLECAS